MKKNRWEFIVGSGVIFLIALIIFTAICQALIWIQSNWS